MDVPSVLDLAMQVKGFLDQQEGLRLYHLACEAALLGPCLEIGSYCGKSTLFLGAACQERRMTLFSIDHHGGSEEQQPGEAYFDPELFDPFLYQVDTCNHFRQTLKRAGLEETVVALVSRSEVAARHWATPLSLVFIDGGHAYRTVLSDYTCWHPHLQPGGLLVFHDIYPNPQDGGQAPYEVYRSALSSGGFRALPMTGSLGVLQRIA